MNKYHNKRVVVDNINFHSIRESMRYGELKMLQRMGEITELELQPKFPIAVNEQKICTYIADFRYWKDGKAIIEDVKGAKTALYSLKKKLVQAIYSIEIIEV